MNQDAVTVQRIHLERVVPAVRLFHALHLALSVQVFVPAVCGVILADLAGQITRTDPWSPDIWMSRLFSALPSPVGLIIGDLCRLLQQGVRMDFRNALSFLIQGVILATVGAAISRSAGRRYCFDLRTGAFRATRDAILRWRPLLVASLLATAIPGSIWLCLQSTGWLAEVTGLASLANQLVWLWLWCLSFLVCAVTVVFGAGWILAIPAIGADDCSGSDALSRGVSYVLSHFAAAVCHGFVVLFITWGSGMILQDLGLLAAQLASSAVSVEFLASMTPAGVEIRQSAGPPESLMTAQIASGAGFPAWLIHSVVSGLRLGILFSGATISYLLLRHREDGIGLTELGGKDHRQPGSPVNQ